MRVNENTTLGEIKQLPELAEVKEILLVRFPELRDDMTLKDIELSAPRYDAESLILGVNRLLEIKEEGRSLNLPMYSAEDIAASPDKAGAALTFFPGKRGAPYVVLCSGGGYILLTNLTEAFPTAAIMNRYGYNVFVVTYRTAQPALLPKPQDDLAAAVAYIETHADELGVKKGEYAVGGYSAGGHLSATWGTKKFGYRKYGLPAPSALLLSYPGVEFSKMGEPQNDFWRELVVALFGADGSVDREEFDVIPLVDAKYPPSYIWHCKDDDEIPYETVVRFDEALERCGVRHQMDSFEHGGHGRGAALHSEAEGWIEHALCFWRGKDALCL